MIRLAKKEDEKSLIALWQLAFGDSVSSIERFFASPLYTEHTGLVWEEKGEVAGAVYLLDAGIMKLSTGENLKAAYTYALATYPAFRGKGIGSALTKENKKRSFQLGYDLHFLRPGEPSLFSYYKTLGFSYSLSIWEEEMRLTESESSSHQCQVETVDLEKYLAIRESLLPKERNEYPVAYLRYALGDLGPKGALCILEIEGETACAFVEKTEEGLFLREVLPQSLAKQVTEVLMVKKGAKKAVFRTEATAQTGKAFLLADLAKEGKIDLNLVYSPFVLD